MYTSCNATAVNLGKTVSFYTLGCKLNYSETSAISRQFEQAGYRKIDYESGADIVVINTCSVTENADKKCKDVVSRALKYNKNSFIIIIGCYAQLKPEEIAKIKGIDAVLGANEKFDILNILESFEKKSAADIYVNSIKSVDKFISSYSLGDRTRTFLKVQDGCNYFCSFCTIPLARGKSRSTPIEDVLKNVKEIIDLGVKEIVLTGINLGDYGIINGRRVTNFFNLIQELEKITEIERYRISSIEPNLLSNEIIDFVAQAKKFAPHFHIPLQSGSDDVLRKMRRRYDTVLYKERVTKILELKPQCCIGVDVIVGFPGETEENFLETYNFLNDLPISYLHVFPYSERANTHAISLQDSIPSIIRMERAKKLRILSDKKQRRFYDSQLRSRVKVLFENDFDEERKLVFGFSENYVKVGVPKTNDYVNKVVEVELKSIDPQAFVHGVVL